MSREDEIATLATELTDGGAPCLCDEIAPEDRPCLVCEARQYIRERQPLPLAVWAIDPDFR